jgi:hypothetical protein
MDCRVTSSHVLYIYIFYNVSTSELSSVNQSSPSRFSANIVSHYHAVYIFMKRFFFFFSEWVLFLGGEAEGHQIPAFLLQLEVRYLPSVS